MMQGLSAGDAVPWAHAGRRSQAGSRRRQRGLTLLELLVAFSIMAMSLGMLYKAMGGSARQAGDLARRQEAGILALTVLSMRDSVTAQGWQDSGSSGAYAWSVSSQPFETASVTKTPLHQITVTVGWSDGGSDKRIVTHTLLPQRLLGPGETPR
jgi:general secretion pathway protein I